MRKNSFRRAIALACMVGLLLIAPARAAFLGNHPDASFRGGKVTTIVGGNTNGATDVAVQPDGKIVAVGTIGTTNRNFHVFRYSSDGFPDATFGTNGRVTTDFNGGVDEPEAVVVQPDGKTIVAGSTLMTGTPNTRFALARYNPNGSLDTTFDVDGRVTTDFDDDRDDTIYDLALQSDGKIIATGYTGINTATTRYNSDGLLDTSFDDDGKVSNFSGDVGARAVAIQPDGKIVTMGGKPDFWLARLRPDGSHDSSFDSDGVAQINLLAHDVGFSIAILPDGKIIAAGITSPDDSLVVARLNPNGTLDNSFGTGGRVFQDLDPVGGPGYRTDVVIQPDGKIVAIGKAFADIAVFRFNSDGSVDNGFGNLGMIHSDFGNDGAEFAARVAIGPNNKLVVVGTTYVNGNTAFAIARYSTDLSLPRPSGDFDGDGVSDFAVFRPSNGAWYVLGSYNSTITAYGFGISGDVPVDGDFNGDDRNDFAVFRPSSGVWYITYTSNGQFAITPFGQSGDKPVPSDYDRDGKTDIAVWRPSNGVYYIQRSSDGQFGIFQWGANGDIPIQSALVP